MTNTNVSPRFDGSVELTAADVERLPYVSLLPGDFTDRLERLKEAIGIDYKQMYRWHNDGVEPSGGAYHSLVLFASRIPGGLEILFGEGFQMTFFKD